MKRSSEGPHEKRKRFANRFPPIDFPQVNGKQLLLTDFMPCARSNAFDVIVTNLCACSSVFTAMFEGDSASILANISDEALLILYEIIYDTIDGRKNRNLPDTEQFKECVHI